MPRIQKGAAIQAKKLGLTWSGSAWLDKNGKPVAKTVKSPSGDTRLVRLKGDEVKKSAPVKAPEVDGEITQGKGVQFEWAIVHQALMQSKDKNLESRIKNSDGNLTKYESDVAEKAAQIVSMLPQDLLKTAKHSDELGITGDPEPKTDIVFGENKEMKVSVKLDGAIQLSSAQGQGTAKMLSAIADESTKKGKDKIISGIIDEVSKLPTKMVDPKNLKKFKERHPKLAQEFCDEKGNLLDKYNWQVYNEKYGRKLQEKITKYLENDDEFLENLIHEGLTGERLFKDNPDAVATHILSPSGMFKIDSKYTKSIKKGVKIRIRAKSRAGITAPVMSIDLDPKKALKESVDDFTIDRDDVKENLDTNFDEISKDVTDNLDIELTGNVEQGKPENLVDPENQVEPQPESSYPDLSPSEISQKLRKELELPEKPKEKKISFKKPEKILFDRTPVKESVLEEKTTKYVFTFGRFNPPTKGHEKLVGVVVNTATKLGAKCGIYPSVTTDSDRNPIKFTDKVRFMRASFPNVEVSNNSKLTNPFIVMKHLSDLGYKELTMVVGQDRVAEFKEISNRYVKSPGKTKLDVKSLDIVSAGERDPDSNDDVESISASKMRGFAKTNNLADFMKNCPSKLTTKQKVEMFKILRKNLKEGYVDNTDLEMLLFIEEYENYCK